MNDLRLQDFSILFPNCEIETAPRTPSGYIPVKVSRKGVTKYASIGEFKIFSSTEEKFLKATSKPIDYFEQI